MPGAGASTAPPTIFKLAVIEAIKRPFVHRKSPIVIHSNTYAYVHSNTYIPYCALVVAFDYCNCHESVHVWWSSAIERAHKLKDKERGPHVNVAKVEI